VKFFLRRCAGLEMWWLLTSEVHVGVSEVREADPHPGHLLGYPDVCFAVGSAEGVGVAVLRVAVAFGVVL
jgi:hypothetical protein